MADTTTILYELKETLLPDFRQFRDFLRMVLPPTEDDERLINVFKDMLSEMITDIENAESIYDLKEWFNVYEMVNDWDYIKNNLTQKYTYDVIKFMNMINDNYTNGLYGDNE